MNRDFTFAQARDLVDYLRALGIGDCYLSPILTAVPGSPHGYDVTDPSKLNPDIGSLDDFRSLSSRLKEAGMGLIADVVPNHMAIGHPSNGWWWDVLESGPHSRFARYFDIDWHPPKAALTNKVLCPILGDQYGRVLEDRQIAVVFRERDFCVTVPGSILPLATNTWPILLQPALERLRNLESTPARELQEILDGLIAQVNLETSDAADPQERRRALEILKSRLAELAHSSAAALSAIEAACEEINGTKGVPSSFDGLEELLARQYYRLCYWRVASDEINYRRFFDVNNLAAIRVEDREVFGAVHALIFELVREGHIQGLRVDHPDGLWDPSEYFHRLQACSSSAAGTDRPFYIVSEKILTRGEAMRSDWEIAGTTGYDFLGVLNGLFVDRRGHRAFERLYQTFTGESQPVEDLVYECKRLILQTSLASELNLLTMKLDRISEQHRWSRDFTRQSLRHVLRETIACFPVYRTYTQERDSWVGSEDETHIRTAISRAKRRNPYTNESIFDFLESVLLLNDPDGLHAGDRSERRRFVLSFQQFTGPLMAKGVEDTAFYRHVPLASLNEVGGHFDPFGTTPADFHHLNLEHLESWTHTLLATSTHDSKRSEDVRARLNVLSEIPAEWDRAIRQWRSLNARHRTELAGVGIPSASEEYFFYQELLGMWPMQEPGPEEYKQLRERIQAHMMKALREAKVRTGWMNPDVAYEKGVADFVRAVLEPADDNHFPAGFRQFVQTVLGPGMWNALSQTLLKIGAPGVPDFYQGTEIWNLTLVDPDNRQPVDYTRRRCLLEQIERLEQSGVELLLEQLMRNPETGAIKLYVTSRALRFRSSHHPLFATGAYLPLRGVGDRQRHVVALARVIGNRSTIVVAGRHFVSLGARDRTPVGDLWGDSVLLLRKELGDVVYRDVFTHRVLEVEGRKGRRVLPLVKIFSHLPVALLEGEHME